MSKTRLLLLAGLFFPLLAAADRKVHFNGDFESGKVRSLESQTDGFRIRTLPVKQRGNEMVVVSAGGGGPNSGLDTRVVRSESVKSELVQPRAGNFFARSALHFDKDYSGWNGGKFNNPRSALNISGESNK